MKNVHDYSQAATDNQIELVGKLREAETTIEGLGQENTYLGQKLEELAEASRLAVEALKDLSEVPLSDLVDSIAVIRHQLEYALKNDG